MGSREILYGLKSPPDGVNGVGLSVTVGEGNMIVGVRVGCGVAVGSGVRVNVAVGVKVGLEV